MSLDPRVKASLPDLLYKWKYKWIVRTREVLLLQDWVKESNQYAEQEYLDKQSQ